VHPPVHPGPADRRGHRHAEGHEGIRPSVGAPIEDRRRRRVTGREAAGGRRRSEAGDVGYRARGRGWGPPRRGKDRPDGRGVEHGGGRTGRRAGRRRDQRPLAGDRSRERAGHDPARVGVAAPLPPPDDRAAPAGRPRRHHRARPHRRGRDPDGQRAHGRRPPRHGPPGPGLRPLGPIPGAVGGRAEHGWLGRGGSGRDPLRGPRVRRGGLSRHRRVGRGGGARPDRWPPT
jgi:hypothetical protein